MTTTMTTTAPSAITQAQWRQLILPIADEIIEEETNEFDWLNEDDGDTAGALVFNGLLFALLSIFLSYKTFNNYYFYPLICFLLKR